MTTENSNEEQLKPITAYVPEKDKRRLRILAAKRGTTMSALANEIYYAGLKLVEDIEETEEEAQQAAAQAS